MRKLYSLVLIAAGLLIGTNSWAGLVSVDYITGTKAGQHDDITGLQAAVESVIPGDSAKITLNDYEYLTSVVKLNGQKICLNLAGNTIEESGASGTGCFEIYKGTLHVTGSGIINHSVKGTGSNVTRSAITVLGADVESKTQVWSTLIIDEDVLVTTNANAKQYGITIDASSADPSSPYTTYQASGSTNPCAINGSFGCAYGVKILVKGTVFGQQRGINIAGNINAAPECDTNPASLFPYIKVYPTAQVYCYSDDLSSGNGGIYAGGYCKIDVSGNVHGQTGIFMKSGDLTLTDATVASDSQNSKASGNYGGDVAGTGVFIASDQGYAGEVSVKVEGATTITSGSATTAAAIVDVYADNSTDNTQVSHIAITGGTIEGNIQLTTKTGDKTEVTGGTLPETVKIGGTDKEVTSLIPPTATVHTTTVTDPATGKDKVIVVEGAAPAKYDVTLNSFGLATFSATETVNIPSGLNVYKAGDMNVNNELSLASIGGAIIPAGTGVILYNENGGSYELTVSTSTTSVTGISNNNLKPATSWRITETDVYILHGNELYKYEGTEFKANKAYLKLPISNVAPGSNSAPARISLRFAETEETQAVENVAPEAVKAVKFVGEDGKLYIRRGEAVYTVQGQLVK